MGDPLDGRLAGPTIDANCRKGKAPGVELSALNLVTIGDLTADDLRLLIAAANQYRLTESTPHQADVVAAVLNWRRFALPPVTNRDMHVARLFHRGALSLGISCGEAAPDPEESVYDVMRSSLAMFRQPVWRKVILGVRHHSPGLAEQAASIAADVDPRVSVISCGDGSEDPLSALANSARISRMAGPEQQSIIAVGDTDSNPVARSTIQGLVALGHTVSSVPLSGLSAPINSEFHSGNRGPGEPSANGGILIVALPVNADRLSRLGGRVFLESLEKLIYTQRQIASVVVCPSVDDSGLEAVEHLKGLPIVELSLVEEIGARVAAIERVLSD